MMLLFDAITPPKLPSGLSRDSRFKTLASFQKQPKHQDGWQSGRQQGQQVEVVSLDRLILAAFRGASATVRLRPSN
jgi:hypothetical protein